MLHMEVEDLHPQPARTQVVTPGRLALLAGGVLAIVGVAQLAPGQASASKPTPQSAGRIVAEAAAPSLVEKSGKEPSNEPNNKPGADRDVHECQASAGYEYCPRTEKCARAWEQKCPGGYEGSLHCAPSQRAYPRAWSEPPRAQSKDMRHLPADAGMGSSTLADWIQMHMNADVGTQDVSFEATYYSQNGQAFPQSWGAPPNPGTTDVVSLPGSFGEGSSSLKMWIQDHMDADKKHELETSETHYSPNQHVYPALWEAPPHAHEDDAVQELPCNYGKGSSTEADWMQSHMDDDGECGTVYKDEETGKCFIGTPIDMTATLV